jgi:hypothetical protein
MESIVSLVSFALQACSLLVIKCLVAIRPYLSMSEGVVVLPSCYIPHSNKLPFATIEIIVSGTLWLYALAHLISSGVVILVILNFMKPTVNTLVSTNCRSLWLVQLKNPLEFKSNIRPKGNVTGCELLH